MADSLDDMDLPADLRAELMACTVAKGVSYAWLCGIYRRGVSVTIGSTGTFPYGKLDPHDEGELAVAIAADPRHGVVRFEFGKLIASLALPAKHARQLAARVAGEGGRSRQRDDVKPTDRTLAAMWATYRAAVIPPGTSSAAIRNNQFAFYGGASYVLDLVLKLGESEVSEAAAGIDALANLNRELHLFAAQQQALLKPGD